LLSYVVQKGDNSFIPFQKNSIKSWGFKTKKNIAW
jgi:N6-adenosine-specific RNA methylase IME4